MVTLTSTVFIIPIGIASVNGVGTIRGVAAFGLVGTIFVGSSVKLNKKRSCDYIN